MSGKLPVTVVVPVRNEAANLAYCLERLARFEHVVVVDSGSTDDTAAIALSHGAEVLQFRWDGHYPKKRNWVLLKHPPKTAWVLFLDADEQVTDAFCDALAAILPMTVFSGFWLNYTSYFRRQRLKYGVPQRKLALLRVGAGLYERIDEDSWSGLDMEVHEHPVIEGSVGEISEPIDHRDEQGLEKFLRRHIDYARWECRRYLSLRAAGNGAESSLTPRQRFKYRHLASWWYAGFYFAYAYIVRLGFLDGAAGLQYALYKAWYFYTIRLLIADATGQPAEPASTGMP